MSSLENENMIGLGSYFGGRLQPHTKAVHQEYSFLIHGIPDGQRIPQEFEVSKFYAEGETIYTFQNVDGSKFEMYHSHDRDVTNWADDIPVKFRIVE